MLWKNVFRGFRIFQSACVYAIVHYTVSVHFPVQQLKTSIYFRRTSCNFYSYSTKNFRVCEQMHSLIFFYYSLLQHLHILEDMSRDFALGEHLLLVGNQGVGKNKIVDRFLHLLNVPREYLQLHRYTISYCNTAP